jgi:hypothetical protein
MPRTRKDQSARLIALNIRKLKRDLKAILLDVHREIRFLDLLFIERNSVRTEVEREVLKEMIERAKKMIEFHQNRLERYRECYRQVKERKSFDRSLLKPEELQSLLKLPAPGLAELAPGSAQSQEGLRTGTDG